MKSETKKITLLDSVETEEKSSGEKEESSTRDERGEKKGKGTSFYLSCLLCLVVVSHNMVTVSIIFHLSLKL